MQFIEMRCLEDPNTSNMYTIEAVTAWYLRAACFVVLRDIGQITIQIILKSNNKNGCMFKRFVHGILISGFLALIFKIGGIFLIERTFVHPLISQNLVSLTIRLAQSQ